MTAVLARLAPRTLRGRLSLVALTAAALLMTFLTVAFNTVVRHHLQRQADDELRTRAAAVATTVDTSGPTVRVRESPDDGLLDTNVWIYTGTRLLEQPPSPAVSLTHAAEQLAAHGRRDCTTATTTGHAPGRIRLWSRPLRGGDHPATVVTALDLAPYRGSADTLLLGSLALDVAMLGCTYVLTRLAVGRALRPVRTMTDQATQRNTITSEERFGTVRHPVELARLGTSLDTLLDRIRTVLRHERQLTGELSHELRTPLSRIVAELDWWRARPRSTAETRATHQVIADATRSMRTICDTLLDDARGGTHTTGTAQVRPVLCRLVEHLDVPDHVTISLDDHQAHHAHQPHRADPAACPEAGVPPALLERIVSPLLANALRYARSSVVVRTARESGSVRVDITDDGPGVPRPFIDQLFQPGRRADPGDGHGGAGLGLPLARRLARSAGGEVSYDSGHAPGARFMVRLPPG
ncbi:sensor histidine kinase KdpD [Streptomyces sp. PSAA01]|uniref:sensor histidine kinase n=1 Tax=Streptomyces sp. PSAA01 TaxID=2912762 RepID=UPI001F338EB2|nr:HAMP domain-containing sensor histidine kinase [Streptomyces sp. PSAA01]MCG0283703.1 HAMP domain-containing histidine kinase [Streptomyces sp. PSAA01]